MRAIKLISVLRSLCEICSRNLFRSWPGRYSRTEIQASHITCHCCLLMSQNLWKRWEAWRRTATAMCAERRRVLIIWYRLPAFRKEEASLTLSAGGETGLLVSISLHWPFIPHNYSKHAGGTTAILFNCGAVLRANLLSRFCGDIGARTANERHVALAAANGKHRRIFHFPRGRCWLCSPRNREGDGGDRNLCDRLSLNVLRQTLTNGKVRCHVSRNREPFVIPVSLSPGKYGMAGLGITATPLQIAAARCWTCMNESRCTRRTACPDWPPRRIITRRNENLFSGTAYAARILWTENGTARSDDLSVGLSKLCWLASAIIFRQVPRFIDAGAWFLTVGACERMKGSLTGLKLLQYTG